MRRWEVQDAKARFGELFETCLKEGPQIVSKQGAAAVVLVPMTEWQRLQRFAMPTLKQLLLTDEGRADLHLPKRGLRRRRVV